MKEMQSSYIYAFERSKGVCFTALAENLSFAKLYKQNLICFSQFMPFPSFSLLAYAKQLKKT